MYSFICFQLISNIFHNSHVSHLIVKVCDFFFIKLEINSEEDGLSAVWFVHTGLFLKLAASYKNSQYICKGPVSSKLFQHFPPGEDVCVVKHNLKKQSPPTPPSTIRAAISLLSGLIALGHKTTPQFALSSPIGQQHFHFLCHYGTA